MKKMQVWRYATDSEIKELKRGGHHLKADLGRPYQIRQEQKARAHALRAVRTRERHILGLHRYEIL